MSKSDEFQAHAEECQRMADRSVDDVERSQWLRLAQSWLRMIHTAVRPRTDGFDLAQPKGTGQAHSKLSH